MLQFFVTLKTWLKLAGSFIKKIVGSPAMEEILINIIAAEIPGMTPAVVQELWTLLEMLAKEANELFTGPKQGDAKYRYVTSKFALCGKTLPTKSFDGILHNILLHLDAEKVKLALENSQSPEAL